MPIDPTSSPEGIPIGARHLPWSAVRFVMSRSSGPGGQNVNKLSTKATLRVRVEALGVVLDDGALDRVRLNFRGSINDKGELVITSQESRSPMSNRASCVERLREMLIASMRRPRVRKKTRPTRASKERRIDDKKKRGEVKRKRSSGRDVDD